MRSQEKKGTKKKKTTKKKTKKKSNAVECEALLTEFIEKKANNKITQEEEDIFSKKITEFWLKLTEVEREKLQEKFQKITQPVIP